MNEQVIRMSIDTTNRFFSSINDELGNMFKQYTNNPKTTGISLPKGMSFQYLPLSSKLTESLKVINSIEEGNVNFDLGQKNNFIFGLFPNSMKNSLEQNTKLKGKKFKAIIKQGVDNYMLVDVTLNNQQGKLQIADMNITSDIFKSPSAVSKYLPSNKVVEDAYTMTPDGLKRIQNHDYYNIVDRFVKLNYAINNGSNFSNSDLLSMVITSTNQSSSPNKFVNGTTATSLQTFQGVTIDSPSSSVISDHSYISGKALNEVLIENTSGINVNDDMLYKINFDISSKSINSVEEFTDIGVKNEDFISNPLIKNPNLTKERVMDLVGYENSKLRHLLTAEEIDKYNKAIEKLNSNGKLNSKNANIFAEKLILEQQTKTLNSYDYYAFLTELLNDEDKKQKFVQAGITDLNGENYIKAFNLYYKEMGTDTVQEADIYNYVNNFLDKKVIAANILEGKLFDNYLDVAKQSANIAGKVRYMSQAEFTPFGHMNTDLQRKAQAANKFQKLSLTTSSGTVFEPTEIIKEILGNSVKEFEYKKTKFNYVQGQAIAELAGERGSTDIVPSLYKSQAKVLYANTPLAFQDSNLFTNSFSLQNISMYNNKKPMIIKYSSLTKDVFGDATQDEIQNFLTELQSKKYQFDQLSESNIKNNFIKNLLGEEAYSKYMAYRNAGDVVIDELKSAFSSMKNLGSISQNEDLFTLSSSESVGNFNAWINKYALKSNGEAIVNILNPKAVESGQNTKVSGSNYNIIESIRFTKEGIELDLKHILLQSGGTKTMLDNVKATTQGLTDIIKVKSDDYSHYVEGIINEKITKGSRGFSGTFFARSLYTMASNSLYADYQNKSLTPEEKFLMFKNTLSETELGFGANGKKINIFDLLNVDLEYDNNTIYFKDKNVQQALDSRIIDKTTKRVTAQEYFSGISLDARIKNAMNENLKKLYGRELTVEESKILGSWASDLLYGAYDNLRAKMTKESALANRVRIKNPLIYKSYIAGNKVGMALENELKDGIDEYAYLFNADIYMMEESKKRAIEEGLKVGRLTGLTLSEIGFNDLVDVIKNKSSYELTDVLKGYLMLTAESGTEFERGTTKFNAFFSDVIDLSDNSLIYNKIGMNVSINDYLKDSPIGRLLKFNADKGRLEVPTKGIIQGFDNNYINDLKKFYESNHIFKDFNILSGTSVFQSEIELNKRHLLEIGFKTEDIEFLKTKSKEIFSNIDIKKLFYNDKIKEIIKSDDFDAGNASLDIYKIYKKQLYAQFKNTNLTESQKGILKVLWNTKDSSDVGFNFFKSFVSLTDTMNVIKNNRNIIWKDDLKEELLDFNFSKGSLNSLTKFYSNNPLIENRGVIASLFSSLDNIQGVNMEANLLDLKEISKFGSIPFIIDSLSVDAVGKIVPNQTINKLEKIIQTNMEIKELYKMKNLLSYSFEKNDILQLNKQSADGKQLARSFKNFLDKHSNLKFDKDGALSSISKLFKDTLISDIDLSSLDNRSFFNLLMLSDENNEEIKKKLSTYIFDLKKSKTSTTLNSNFISMLKKSGISENIISNAEMEIIKSFDEKYLVEPRKFIDRLETLENNFKDKSEEVYNNIHKFKNEIIDFIGESYKKEFFGNITSINDIISNIDEANFSSGTDAERFVYNTITDIRKSIGDIKIKLILANKKNGISIDKQISDKQRKLTSMLINRNYHLGETILTKGGILFDATSISIANSAAISPREGSAITSFIRTEMRELLQNRKFENGEVVISNEYDDFKKALKLIYGDYLVDEELKKFDELYMSKENLDWNIIKKSTNEIKQKLDNYSHIIVGDRNMYTLNGQIGMFKNDRQFAYGMLSRHPHQYKFSVTPTRYVLLNEADKALSFIGKYIGTGNTVDGTQSSLYTIGKKTALGAKGDFDGDVFQIMFLGDKDLDYRRYKGMETKKFLGNYRKKLELYNLLINSTSDDLESIFYGNPELVSKNKKYKRIKSLVGQLYFDKDYRITNKEAYDAIKDSYLSLVHENVRVMKMLADEHHEHAVIPEVFGEFDFGNGRKISKRSITELLLTLPDEVRNRYLIGDYNRFDISEVIKNNANLSDIAKQEYANILKNDDGQEIVVKAIEEMKKDEGAITWQMLHRHLNKFRDEIGLYKTPNVHTKLTNFRNALDAMKNKETYAKALAYLHTLQGTNETVKLFVDSHTLSVATSSHDIGTLIEKLAISSKKGSVSPDLKLTQFLKAEELIRNNNIDFNYKLIANMVEGMQSALARNKSQDSIISNTFFKTIFGEQFDPETQKDFLNMNFDDWFKSLYVNINSIEKDDYFDLKKAFLILSDVSNIDNKLKNGSLSVYDMFDGNKKTLSNANLSTSLSNWTGIMFKGQLERVLKISGELNSNVYKQIFNVSGNTNFSYQFRKLWNVVTNPSEWFGTRDEANVVIASAGEIIKEKIDKSTQVEFENSNTTADIIRSNERQNPNYKNTSELHLNTNRINDNEHLSDKNKVDLKTDSKSQSFENSSKKISDNKKTNLKNKAPKDKPINTNKLINQINTEENVQNIVESVSEKIIPKIKKRKTKAQKEFEQLQNDQNAVKLNFEVPNESDNLVEKAQDNLNNVIEQKNRLENNNKVKSVEEIIEEVQTAVDNVTDNIIKPLKRKRIIKPKIKNESPVSVTYTNNLIDSIDDVPNNTTSSVINDSNFGLPNSINDNVYLGPDEKLNSYVGVNSPQQSYSYISESNGNLNSDIPIKTNQINSTVQEVEKSLFNDVPEQERKIIQCNQNKSSAQVHIHKENSSLKPSSYISDDNIFDNTQSEYNYVNVYDDQFDESSNIHNRIGEYTNSQEQKAKQRIINQSSNKTVTDGIIRNEERKKTQKIIDDIRNQVESLKDEIENLKQEKQEILKKKIASDKTISDQTKQINELNKKLDAEKISKQEELNKLKNELDKKIEEKQKEIEKLNSKISKLGEKLREKTAKLRQTITDSEVYKRIKESETVTNTSEKVKEITNSDLANAAKDKISKHKKALVVAGGVTALAAFFRIFQSNRPVVNLDINEQEYERSQGSLYRNLGQYTMNTNIRSLY